MMNETPPPQPSCRSGITRSFVLRQQITILPRGYEMYKSVFNKWLLFCRETENKTVSIHHRCWFHIFILGGAAAGAAPPPPQISLEAELCNDLDKLYKKRHIDRIIQRHEYTQEEILQHKLFFVKFRVYGNVNDNKIIHYLCEKYHHHEPEPETSVDGTSNTSLIITVSLKDVNRFLSIICNGRTDGAAPATEII